MSTVHPKEFFPKKNGNFFPTFLFDSPPETEKLLMFDTESRQEDYSWVIHSFAIKITKEGRIVGWELIWDMRRMEAIVRSRVEWKRLNRKGMKGGGGGAVKRWATYNRASFFLLSNKILLWHFIEILLIHSQQFSVSFYFLAKLSQQRYSHDRRAHRKIFSFNHLIITLFQHASIVRRFSKQFCFFWHEKLQRSRK